jgi:hypothetical protein
VAKVPDYQQNKREREREREMFHWELHNNMFSVIYDETGCPFQPKNYFKISLKIKIFLWLIQLGVILTKDDLVKRKWKGRKKMLLL